MTTSESGTRSKRFLVIGATGQVGSRITGRLAEEGCGVNTTAPRAGAVVEDRPNKHHTTIASCWEAARAESVNARVIGKQLAAGLKQ